MTRWRRFGLWALVALLAAGCQLPSLKLPTPDPLSARRVEPVAPPAPLWLPADGPVVRSLAFTPDGRTLAVAAGNAGDSRTRSVELHDVTTGRLTLRLEGHQDTVMAVAFRPDGRQIASVALDGMLRLWDTGEGTPVGELALPVAVHPAGGQGPLAVAYTPDGQSLLVAGEAGALFWQPGEPAPEQIMIDIHAPAALSADGAWIAASTGQRGYRSVRRSDGTHGIDEPAETGLCGPVFDPTKPMFAICLRSGQVRLVNAADGKVIRTLAGHPDGTYAAAFSGDGSLLATTGVDASTPGDPATLPTAGLRLWRVADGALLAAYTVQQGNLATTLAVSPDHLHIAVGTSDAQVALWSLPALLDGAIGRLCPEASADAQGYLRTICIYVRVHKIDVSPGTPDGYGIKWIDSTTQEGRAIDRVFLTCCYLDDVAEIDPATRQVIDFHLGAQ